MNKISFIHIKPNYNRELVDQINNNIFKIANLSDSSIINKEIENITDDLDEIIILINNLDPVSYINNFFNNKYDIKSEKSYDIMSYDRTENNYYLLIYDNYLNSTKYLSSLTNEIRDKEFNLIGSNLIKSYTDTILFGDLFILSIDRSYYDLLLNLDKNKNIELLLKNFNKIYYDITLYDFIMSYKNTYYIKIYVKSTNNIYIYQKYVINALININYQLIENNIIKIINNNIEIFVKISTPLPNSYHEVMNSIKDYKTSEDFYLIDIKEEDILYLLGK